MGGNSRVTLALLQHGAELDIRSDAGETLMSMAVTSRNEVLVDAAFQSASRRSVLLPETLQAALTMAVVEYSPNTIKYLVKKGAGVNRPPAGAYSNYPSYLILAAERKPASIPLLLQLGADPKFKDASGKTALDRAHLVSSPERRQKAIKALTLEK